MSLAAAQRSRIGTRQSPLAIKQSESVAEALRASHAGIVVEMKKISTKGDKILDVPLAKIGGKGLFTKEIENELLAGDIDLAVHSMKDMPTELPEGLCIAAMTPREDPRDAFVSSMYDGIIDLPRGARVGTSSLRRRAQLLAMRPDLDVCDLRGSVGTRLARLDGGELDAVILAAAGLKRLGLAGRMRAEMDVTMMTPAAGQGVLAVECRSDDRATREMLAAIDDADSRETSTAERAFLAEVGGGCQVPVGAFAEPIEGGVRLIAVIASIDGRRMIRGETRAKSDDIEGSSRELARSMLADGGRKILEEIGIEVQ